MDTRRHKRGLWPQGLGRFLHAFLQGQTITITLTWTEKGVAKKNAAGWHYQYLVQRQAGVTWDTERTGHTASMCREDAYIGRTHCT